MLVDSINDTIGNTPLLRCGRLEEAKNFVSSIYCKLESFNPTHSIRDRFVYALLQNRLWRGVLQKGDTISLSEENEDLKKSLCAISSLLGREVVSAKEANERHSSVHSFDSFLPLAEDKGARRLIRELDDEFVSSLPETVLIPSDYCIPFFDDFESLLLQKDPNRRIIRICLSKDKTVQEDKSFVVTKEEAALSSSSFEKAEGIQTGLYSGAILHALERLCQQKEYFFHPILAILPD